MNKNYNPKIAIGGIGGSGTRAVAELFKNLGYFMGYDLNAAFDTLLYTLMFKRKDILLLSNKQFHDRLRLFYKIMATDEPILNVEYDYLYALADNNKRQGKVKRLRTLVDNYKKVYRLNHQQWAWKAPNTHIVIDKILDNSPNLKFIYVYRNGLDMAYSSNQNQLKFFGNVFLNDDTVEINPKNSLKYWSLMHRRMLKFQKIYSNQIYMLNLEQFCQTPSKNLHSLFRFLDLPEALSDNESLQKIFKMPASKDRYKKHSLEGFYREDLDYVQTIYPISN